MKTILNLSTETKVKLVAYPIIAIFAVGAILYFVKTIEIIHPHVF